MRGRYLCYSNLSFSLCDFPSVCIALSMIIEIPFNRDLLKLLQIEIGRHV